MIIKIEQETIDQDGNKIFTETKQESVIPDVKTLAVDERIHLCFHDETPPRPCSIIKKA